MFAVFFLLAVLAGVMRFITAVFPHIREDGSVAHVAAISATFQAFFPGSKVTRIEEIK